MSSIRKNKRLKQILGRALEGRTLGREEVGYLLSIHDERDVESLFEAARFQRGRYLGQKVFLYGFIYFSTYCGNNCLFCRYRASNMKSPRYRKSPPEVLDAAYMLAESGVHLIDLTMGEDPFYYRHHGEKFQEIASIVKQIKKGTGLAVMVSPGVVPDHVLKGLSDAGSDWYACYQETHNRSLFRHLRVGQRYTERMNKKILAKSMGMLVEEGILSGVGDTVVDVADSIVQMMRIDADQVRVMTFVPCEGTPLATSAAPDAGRELITIAVMRLVFPDRLIPASLDVDGLAGLKKRLDAGANVVTSLIMPGQGLSGVANYRLDIKESRRTPGAVLPVLEECQLPPAEVDDYLGWMNQRRLGRPRRDELGSPGRTISGKPLSAVSSRYERMN